MNVSGSELSDFLKIFWQFSWMQWGLFSIAVNIFMYLFSIGLYLLIDKTCHKEKLQQTDHPVNRSDVYLSFITIVCNSFVMILGVGLWKSGWIILNAVPSVISVISEVLVLLLLMDLMMYIFHYVAHIPFVYRLLHGKHHEHTSTNFLSLFVLHPLEVIGFGMMLLILLMVYNFSVVAVMIYLMINLIWGTVGHLNREFFPPELDRFLVGTTGFHNRHHKDESCNFGFYTSLWDRIFTTYKP